MKGPLLIDDICLNQQGTVSGQQLLLGIAMKSLKTGKKSETLALVDSGCARTCVDEDFTRKQGWPLTRIQKPIKVLYMDGSSIESSTIWYSMDLQIRVAGSTVATRALVTRLKMMKVFLGFNSLRGNSHGHRSLLMVT
jgi:hypothetical protein